MTRPLLKFPKDPALQMFQSHVNYNPRGLQIKDLCFAYLHSDLRARTHEKTTRQLTSGFRGSRARNVVQLFDTESCDA